MFQIQNPNRCQIDAGRVEPSNQATKTEPWLDPTASKQRNKPEIAMEVMELIEAKAVVAAIHLLLLQLRLHLHGARIGAVAATTLCVCTGLPTSPRHRRIREGSRRRRWVGCRKRRRRSRGGEPKGEVACGDEAAIALTLAATQGRENGRWGKWGDRWLDAFLTFSPSSQ